MLRNNLEIAKTPNFPGSNFYNPFSELKKLTPGKRYTFLVESTFGHGAHTIHMNLHAIKTCRFDQHQDCLEIHFKPRGKTRICQILFYGEKSFAVWDGWIDIEDRLNKGLLESFGLGKKSSMEEVLEGVPLSPICYRLKNRMESTTH
jgi:hypothetical protein